MTESDILELMYFPSVKAYESVAKTLGISEPLGQDWAWIVSSEVDFEEAMELYINSNNDERHILMEIMVQICADEFYEEPLQQMALQKWNQLRSLLSQSLKIHAFTIHYWSGFEPEHEWHLLAIKMKELWNEIESVL